MCITSVLTHTANPLQHNDYNAISINLVSAACYSQKTTKKKTTTQQQHLALTHSGCVTLEHLTPTIHVMLQNFASACVLQWNSMCYTMCQLSTIQSICHVDAMVKDTGFRLNFIHHRKRFNGIEDKQRLYKSGDVTLLFDFYHPNNFRRESTYHLIISTSFQLVFVGEII